MSSRNLVIARNRVIWRSAFFVALLLIGIPSSAGNAQSDQGPDAFTENTASKLLGRITEGLQGHSGRKMLSAFDLSQMDGGPLFKEQVTAFFNQYDPIRVHFKLVEVKENSVTVAAEIDATPLDAITPPQHKSARIRLAAAKTPAGWKFIDLDPRNFFS